MDISLSFRTWLLMAAAAVPALASDLPDAFNLQLDAVHPQAQEDDFDRYWSDDARIQYDAAAYHSVLVAHPASSRYALYHLTGWVGRQDATDVTIDVGSNGAQFVPAGSVSDSADVVAATATGVAKHYVIQYQLPESSAWLSATSSTFQIHFNGGQTEALIRVIAVNDEDITGAQSVSVTVRPLPNKYHVGSTSQVSVMVADDDVQASFVPLTDVMSEGDDIPVSARIQFATTQGWYSSSGFSSGGLGVAREVDYVLHLDNQAATDPAIVRDATPGIDIGSDYIYIAMPVHNGSSSTGDYGDEHMFYNDPNLGDFSPSGPIRINDWTSGWIAAETAKKGATTVYLNSGDRGHFMVYDYLVVDRKQDALAYQIIGHASGYLVTTTRVLTTSVLLAGEASSNKTVTSSVLQSQQYVNLTDYETYLNGLPNVSYPSGVVQPATSFSTDEQVQSTVVDPQGTKTTTQVHYDVVIGSFSEGYTLAKPLQADLAKDAEVFNYITFEPSGSAFTVRFPLQYYYGLEIGALAPEAVLNKNHVVEVEGAEQIRMSVIDPASFVTVSPDYELLNPGTESLIIADIDDELSWSSVKTATSTPDISGYATATFPAPFPRDVDVVIDVQDRNTVADPTGWAAEGTDFKAISGHHVILRQGQTSVSFPVEPIKNASVSWSESSRRVRFTLKTSNDYHLRAVPGGAAASVDVWMVKGVGLVSLMTTTPSVLEPAAAGSSSTSAVFHFSVARNLGMTGALTVNYTVSGSKTLTTADYDPNALAAGFVTIPANQDSFDLSVPIMGDSDVEGQETLTLTLAEGGGYGLAGSHQATVTINDAAATVSIAVDKTSIDEGGAPATVTLSYSGPQRPAFAVNLAISGSGSGKADATDANVPTSVSFTSTAQTATFPLSAIADRLTEGDETLAIAIQPASGGSAYFIGTPDTVSVTIKDTSTATDSGNNPGGNGDGKPAPSTGGGSTSSGCGLGSGVAGILLGMFLLMRLRLRSDKRSRAA